MQYFLVGLLYSKQHLIKKVNKIISKIIHICSMNEQNAEELVSA